MRKTSLTLLLLFTLLSTNSLAFLLQPNIFLINRTDGNTTDINGGSYWFEYIKANIIDANVCKIDSNQLWASSLNSNYAGALDLITNPWTLTGAKLKVNDGIETTDINANTIQASKYFGSDGSLLLDENATDWCIGGC